MKFTSSTLITGVLVIVLLLGSKLLESEAYANSPSSSIGEDVLATASVTKVSPLCQVAMAPPAQNGEEAKKEKTISKVLASTPTYTLTVKAPKDVASGSTGTSKIIVVPQKGWKLNPLFPTKLMVKGPKGVMVPKAVQKKKDAIVFTEKKAIFDVAFVCPGTGTRNFLAQFKFAVCTETSCDPKKAKFKWAVEIK